MTTRTTATTGRTRRKVIEETMGHLPIEEKRLITGGNAARIWSIDT